MAQRTVEIPGIGQVVLAKRKGSRHLRLSVTAGGRVRVGMPTWTPYSVAISFAKSRAGWINEQLGSYQAQILKTGDQIGKSHTLRFYKIVDSAPKTKTRVTSTTIEVKTSLDFDSAEAQTKATAACNRALKSEAIALLPGRLAELASASNHSYKDVQIKKLTSRWGSCSSQKSISLSYYLVQLPWLLIDYVLMHELTHTKHLHHGKEFWAALEQTLPGAKLAKKAIKTHKPQITPVS
jgi:predicted metal-dependent hydrolase